MNQMKLALSLVISLILLAGAGVAAALLSGFTFSGLHLVILALIFISAIYAFVTSFKQHKEVKEGFPAEDELSLHIKYKAGHHAFLASMYLWLFIFLFKDFFPDTETMLGSGILLSSVIAMVIRAYLTRQFGENQN